MARNGTTNGSAPALTSEGITRISVAGFKSIRDEQSIEIRPLTILAGANSSGKSSIMQPLLLMKQTLEASYDPGALLLNGPNAQFSFLYELFSWSRAQEGARQFVPDFQVALDVRGYETKTLFTTRQPDAVNRVDAEQLRIEQFSIRRNGKKLVLKLDLSSEDIIQQLRDFDGVGVSLRGGTELMVMQNRCYLETGIVEINEEEDSPFAVPAFTSHLIHPAADQTQRLIHVPGIRGDVKNAYPIAATDRNFPGVFDPYVGSVIYSWQVNHDERLDALLDDMQRLSLVTAIKAQRRSDFGIELFVNRLPNASRDTEDRININQVGIGVPVTLSAITALHAAKRNQMVYIEQPELHLHPRAQVAMAHILADAAKRGVRVVVETHSSLLLRGVQTLVAEGKLDPKLVALHWFSRDEEGNTKVDSADLTRAGAFGKWPQDFGDVDLEAQGRYLDAAGLQLLRGA